MIDWHSHILPGIDDGSRNVGESLALLHMLAEQGIDTVIATPHFYANKDSVETFLSRRAQALQLLKSRLPENAPNILCGAEVRYYSGISTMTGLNRLRIEGSQLLLLEMPETRWSEYTIRELSALANMGKISLILAHVERCLPLQSEETLELIRSLDIGIQVNAGVFLQLRTKRKVLAALAARKIHFVGSDCHNTTSRPPQIGAALQVIEKKFGRSFICQLSEFWKTMLTEL